MHQSRRCHSLVLHQDPGGEILSISKSQHVLNLRKTCWPSTATGATAPPPAQGSCPPQPASTTASHEASRHVTQAPQVLVTAQVQPHNAPQPLEPGTLRPLHLGVRHLLHIRSACRGDSSHCWHPTIKTQTRNEKAFISFLIKTIRVPDLFLNRLNQGCLDSCMLC